MAEEERSGGGFLPPEPSGPEPDLGRQGAPRSPPEPDHHGFLPPLRAAPGYAPAPPQPPAASGPPGYPAGPADAPAGWAPSTRVPDNGDALAGLILSISAATLLLLSVGMSSIISVICAALGIYYSRKGRARVDRGETPKHRGVAEAGFWTGVVTLVLSILATILWVTVAILWATDEGFREDLEDELDDGGGGSPDGFETAVPVVLAAVRAVALLLR